jgi:hypothetical protein
LLLFFPKKIAYPDDGICLLLGEQRQQILPDSCRVYGTRSIEFFPAESGEGDEDGFPVNTAAHNRRSFLHSRQLVREATFIPGHHARQHLLPQFTFPAGSEARSNTEFRAEEPGRLADVAPDTLEDIFVHEPEGMPDTSSLRITFERRAIRKTGMACISC